MTSDRESGGSELVEVAFLGDEPEALIVQALLTEEGIPSLLQQVTPSGPQLGYGFLNPGWGSRRVMVHAHRAEEARTLLDERRAEGEREAPEPVNAQFVADGRGRRPRNYGLLGGYARAYLWSLGTLALAFGVFTLVRAF